MNENENPPALTEGEPMNNGSNYAAGAPESNPDELLKTATETAPLSLANVRVAMFRNAYAGKDESPRRVKLLSILDAIRNGEYEKQIRHARELFAAWKAVCPTLDNKKSPEAKAYDDFKKTLPAFCVSGTAASRTEPLQHSGLLQVDLDKLDGTLDGLREKLKADPHIAFGNVSPSGDGLKMGLVIDGERHLESFYAAQAYFRKTYRVEIDPKVKDRLRLCFVSHDPDLWTREDATPLPLPDPAPDDTDPAEPGLEIGDTAEPRILVLPSGAVTISESARAIFSWAAPTRTLLWRGGALAELVETDGVASLDLVKPEGFCSRVEKFGNLFVWRSDGDGKPALKRAQMSIDCAKKIMAATEAREFLPSVASVLRCPVLIETASGDVAILGRGYHPELGGILIVAGDTPPQVPLDEAVASLRWVIEEFSFHGEGDQARALAAFVTPALRLGGHLPGRIPITAIEADFSQAGKGHLLEMFVTTYNELSSFVAQRTGGVGSFDESLSAAFISGRPFPNLDNLRGHIASAYLESFVTCPGLFPARVPHRGEVLVDPKRFILQLSSNGLEATRDLANRTSICRIRKRHGFAYRDTLGELQRRQPYFLGCIFAVIAEWISNGKPRTKDTRHDFREWSQTLDWICQNILGCAPLMDGHGEAQERVSNPALAWLRAVALAMSGENRLGVELTATELVEACELHGVEIVGKPIGEERARRQVGNLCKRLFRDGDTITVDGFTVTRGRKEYRKPSGDMDFTPSYTFTK